MSILPVLGAAVGAVGFARALGKPMAVRQRWRRYLYGQEWCLRQLSWVQLSFMWAGQGILLSQCRSWK